MLLNAATGRAQTPDPSRIEKERSWATLSGPARGIRFEPLSRADGAPADRFYQVVQDRRGFLWFTTSKGLVRYDGYQQVLYPGMPMLRKLAPIAEPGLLFEDRNGNLWVGTDVLSRFDPATGAFTPVVKPRAGEKRFDREAIWAIHDGPGGRLWVSVWTVTMVEGRLHTDSAPVLYEVDPVRRTSVPHAIGTDITRGKNVSIRAILDDAQGRLWLGTSIGLMRFDPATGSFQHYPHTHVDATMQARQKAFNDLARDGTGHLWIHMPAGLERFDPRSGAFDRFIEEKFERMTQDLAGRLWLWGGMRGLKVFDPSAPAESALKSVSFTGRFGQSEGSLAVDGLGIDSRGDVWVCPSGSPVYRYSPVLAKFGSHVPDPADPDSLSAGAISGFAEDADGSMWVSTYTAGLNKLDPRTGAFARFQGAPRNRKGLPDEISVIYRDRSGALWIGGEDGSFGRFEGNRGRYSHVADLLYSITSIFEDSAGRFWVGDMLKPVQLVDKRTGAITPMSVQGGAAVHQDRQGNLWFAFPSVLNKLDPAGRLRSITIREPDPKDRSSVLVASIHEAPDGILWLASNKGLYAFDPATEKAKAYSIAQGLASEDMRCMLPDGNGNLWASTAEGISRFNIREERFYNFDERDGLQGREFNHYACYAARDGRLYFGGATGFNAFYPRDILAFPPDPPLVLTTFRVNGKDIPPPGADGTRLPHRQNNLTFEFAVPNPLNPGRIRYRFKLDGLERRWTEGDSAHRQARYTDLGAGDYVFRAEASFDGRSWDGRGGLFKLTILPPWWRTWWAESLEALALAGLLFGMYKLRVGALHRRQRLLSALVDQRTAELVEARNQAQAASDRAQAANRAKSAFLANMSHELRTPLSAILGFSSLLRDSHLTDEQRQQIDSISGSGEHLLGLINDVLDVAKIEAGKQELATAAGDLIAAVRTVVGMMRVKAEDKNLSLVYEQAPEVPRYVRVDTPKLRQILINLLGNSIKFTREGTVSLRVSATPTDEEGRVQLRFEVQDSGVGIPRQDLGRIFEPFEQVRKPGESAGTGLGLTITRRFVEMMGGTLRAESELGRGSRFTVVLPVELTLESEWDGAEPASLYRFLLEPGQPECRVLIVEDDPENATVLRQLLTRAGFQVRVAENGELGIEAFQEWRPHFIWMDLGMPGLSGAEATSRIRALDGGAEVKIVALTASAYAADREMVISAGFDDLAFKPFRGPEIFGCIARHTGVTYRSSESAGSPSKREPATLRPEAMAALPLELLRKVKQAVIALNSEKIVQLIEETGRKDETLGRALRLLADQYQYTAILTAIERAESEVGRADSEGSNAAGAA